MKPVMQHWYGVIEVCTGFVLRPGDREEAGKLVRLSFKAALVADIGGQRSPAVLEDWKGQEEVRMLLLKSCPHCQEGDLIVQEQGEDGVVADCLQCGYTADESTVQWWLSLPQLTNTEVAEDDQAA